MFGFNKEKMLLDQLEDFKGILIDVREQHEWDGGHIKGAIHIPLSKLRNNEGIDKLDPNKEYVVYCHSQGRSPIAAKMLKSNGFKSVHYLAGGYSLYKLRHVS